MDDSIPKQVDKTGAFSPREFIGRYLRYIPWLILSTALLVVLAYIKLRYSPVIYEVQAKLLIKKDSKTGGSDKFADIFLGGESQNLNDEIQILKSTGITKRIVKNLGLQTSYVSEGNVKSFKLHDSETPLVLDILELKDSLQAFSVIVKFVDENTLNINNNPEPVYFNQVIEYPQVKFRFKPGPVSLRQFASPLFSVIWVPLDDMADGISGGLNIAPVNDYSNVLMITYETENTKIGRDILNQLMKEYNISNVEDKRTTTVYTLEFIDERLDTLKRELSGVERNLQNFRETNKAINLEQQSSINFSELSAGTQTLAAQEVQLRVLDYLQQYLGDQKNSNKTVPTSLGISEPSLQSLINTYNATQLRRETLLLTTPPGNQIVKDLEAELAKLRQQIQESLVNIRNGYLINKENILSKKHEGRAGYQFCARERKEIAGDNAGTEDS